MLLLLSCNIKKIFTQNYDEWNIAERPTRGSNRIYGIGVRDESLRLAARVAAWGSFYRAVLAIEGCSALLG